MPEYTIRQINEQTYKGYELVIYLYSKSWHLNGNYHREDGHAYEHYNGLKHWFLNGNLLDKDWFLKNPDKIVKMKAWELFTPEELVRLKT